MAAPAPQSTEHEAALLRWIGRHLRGEMVQAGYPPPIIWQVLPMGKPRMTQRDKWKGRDVVKRYYAFKDACRYAGVRVDTCGGHVIFVLPMPSSWSKKRKYATNATLHKAKPDKDNLEKALLDALFEDDKAVADMRVTKLWGWRGAIIYLPPCTKAYPA